MNLRGSLTILVVGVYLLFGDLVQRTVIAASVRIFPGRRNRILSVWQQNIADFIIGTVRHIGGATIQPLPHIPAEEGTLVIMNHQSLLDIPLVVASLRPDHPTIITRSRYARGKPLISHMVRLYQYPTVDPRAMSREDVLNLAEVVAGSPLPVVIYPEGTRTRDGRIARFKRAGLSAILLRRQWKVRIVTIDGYWQLRSLNDFLTGSSAINGQIDLSEPLQSPDPSTPESEASVESFIVELEDRMRGSLAILRGEPVPALRGASGADDETDADEADADAAGPDASDDGEPPRLSP